MGSTAFFEFGSVGARRYLEHRIVRVVMSRLTMEGAINANQLDQKENA